MELNRNLEHVRRTVELANEEASALSKIQYYEKMIKALKDYYHATM